MKRFSVALGLAHCGRETCEATARGADIVGLLDSGTRYPYLRLGDQVVDHRTDLRTHQFADQPRRRCIGEARTGRVPAAGDDRHREQLVERQQPGAQAVVDIVIVIGDVVGDRRDLRLKARPTIELERKGRIGLGQRPLGAVIGPLCLASPSSVSQVRLSPSQHG
jgi:hypothetical protein